MADAAPEPPNATHDGGIDATPAKRPPRRWRVYWSRDWRNRLLLALAVAVVLGPVVLILPLRFIDPPFTALMLIRSVERYRHDKTPVFPARVVVPLAAVSSDLLRAILASEDDGFYRHHGFDVNQIEKALEARRRGHRLRGASTISQQTVKNLFLWNGHSFVRKGLEAYLTFYLEGLLPKDRILELYVNLVETGDGMFGVELAAQRYFHVPAREVGELEATRLAAILPNPRRMAPYSDVATQRAAQILDLMNHPIVRPK